MRSLLLLFAFCMCISCEKDSGTSSHQNPDDTTKPVSPPLSAKYINELNGTFAFGRYQHFIYPFDTVYIFSDTAIGIVVIDDSTLTMFGKDYHFTEEELYCCYAGITPDTAEKITFVNRSPVSLAYDWSLTYYFKKDSLVHCFQEPGMNYKVVDYCIRK